MCAHSDQKRMCRDTGLQVTSVHVKTPSSHSLRCSSQCRYTSLSDAVRDLNKKPTMKPSRYAKLCCEEPFRIFFPVGLLIGLYGVLLWPFLYLRVSGTYPATTHARLMSEGFMCCFLFGFLGTAVPRVLAVRHLSGWEVLRLLGLVSAATMAHLCLAHALGDTFFLTGLLLFAASLARRFRQRQDSPPPNFALVGLGILNGVVGAALLCFCEWTSLAPTAYRLGNSLLNVGFVLLPVLGVAPFFLRRLLDLPSSDDIAPANPWTFVLAILVGLTVDASFVLELLSSNPVIGWIRGAVALGFLVMTLPLRGRNNLATSLRMSLAAVAAGLGLMAILPAYRVSAMHVMFIGGFTVAIFSVGARVVLGHSGNLHLLRAQRWFFLVILLLLILAMISRFIADFVASRNQHLLWGAVCWLVATGLWAMLVLPHVAHVEQEST